MKIIFVIYIKNLKKFYNGAPGGTRTPGLELRRLAFYPAKLQTQIKQILYYYIVKTQVFQYF